MKLAICDDMESFCTYYKKLFSWVEDVTVAGTANNGEKCIEMVKKNHAGCVNAGYSDADRQRGRGYN